ncbi:MAG: hypothetical protein R2754_13240 [Microthrixaceae bacterium]
MLRRVTFGSKVGRFATALVMIGSALVLTPGSAGAANGNLSDIDVAYHGDDDYVVSTLSTNGTITVEPVDCTTATTCSRHGWTTLGTGFKAMLINAFDHYGNVVVIGRRANGDTWYRKGSCGETYCSWDKWRSIGGRVVSVRSADANYEDCVHLAGIGPTGGVFQAKVCDYGFNGWSSLGGRLSQIGVDWNGQVYGTSRSGAFYYRESGRWRWAGGNVTQPVNADFDIDLKCGLAPRRNVWCFDVSTRRWTNYGGYWRKLDDGQVVIGISKNWSFQLLRPSYIRDVGGKLNQAAGSECLVVGVGGDYRSWYRNLCYGNGWYRL